MSCPYCGTESVIEGRQPAQPRQGQLVAHYSYPKWMWLVYVVPIALMVAGGGFSLLFSGLGAKGLAGAGGSSSLLHWRAIGWPMVADVNGDGTDDVIGWLIDINTSAGGTSDRLAAFDGRDGSRLWMTDELGDNRSLSSVSAVVGDAIVMVDEGGKARAFEIRDGVPRWQTTLGERAESVCAAPDADGGAILSLADERIASVSTTDGSMRPIKEATCAPTSSTLGPPQDRVTWISSRSSPLDGGKSDLEPPGMSAEKHLREPGANRLVLLGHKTPGTRVPMVAVYQCAEIDTTVDKTWGPKHHCKEPELVFQSKIPSGDPLVAGEGDPDVATVVSGTVYVGYQATSGADVHNVTAFELATGRRLFDVPGLLNPEALVVKHDLQYLLHTNAGLVVDHGYGGASMFDATSGQPKFTIAR